MAYEYINITGRGREREEGKTNKLFSERQSHLLFVVGVKRLTIQNAATVLFIVVGLRFGARQ